MAPAEAVLVQKGVKCGRFRFRTASCAPPPSPPGDGSGAACCHASHTRLYANAHGQRMRAWHLLHTLALHHSRGSLGSVSSGSSSHMRGGSPWPLHPARPQRPSPPSPQRAVHRAAAAPDGCPLVHTADPADPTTYAPATQSTQWAAVHCSPSTICAPRPFEAAFPRAMLLSDAGARAVDLEAWNAQGAAPVVAEPRRELAWATPPRTPRPCPCPSPELCP